MYIKSEAELIYEGQGVAENGSPTILQTSQVIKVDEAETFSNNYYNDQQRNMRLSRNLIIPSFFTNDKILNGVTYELMYVNYDGKKYKVKNILKVRNTRQKMLLDIQEARWNVLILKEKFMIF